MDSIVKRFKKRLKTEINYLFFREYRYKRVVRRHFSKYYDDNHPQATNSRKMVVYMADGKYRHGGLADRLRGIVTLYRYCIEHNLDFRIHFTSPFILEEYLQPNEYDWRLRRGELSFNASTSHACYMDTTGDVGEREMRFQRKITDKFLSQPYAQLHVYSIFYYEEKRFGELFNMLFKPAPVVQAEIDRNLREIGGEYITVSTRFLELLGDFKEPKGVRKELPKAEQEALIQSCIGKIERLKDSFPEIGKIVVTSDSLRFLERVKALEYCYVIPGEIAHIDTKDGNKTAHLKTFVDFFVIAKAKASFLIVEGGMYHSNFSKRAAQVNNHPFTEITG